MVIAIDNMTNFGSLGQQLCKANSLENKRSDKILLNTL